MIKDKLGPIIKAGLRHLPARAASAEQENPSILPPGGSSEIGYDEPPETPASDSKFIIITRLGLGAHSVSHYERALALFEAVTLSSLKAQSDQDFHWLLVLDAALPRFARQRIAELQQGFPRLIPVFINLPDVADLRIGSFDWVTPYIVSALVERGVIERIDQPIITALLDCDDAWRFDMVKRVKSHIASDYRYVKVPAYLLYGQHGLVLTFPQGSTFFPATNATEPMRLEFQSMSVFVHSKFSSGITAVSSRHLCWPLFSQIIGFQTLVVETEAPMWLWTRHGDNLTSSQPQSTEVLPAAGETLAPYGIDMALLDKWRHVRAKERNGAHSLAFLQNETLLQIAALNRQIRVLEASTLPEAKARLAEVVEKKEGVVAGFYRNGQEV